VRRAALGIIRTILDHGLKIDICALIDKALELLPVKKDVASEVQEFFTQRLIIFLENTYKRNVLEACTNPLADLNDYIERVKVVSAGTSEGLLENANRVIRLLNDKKIAHPVRNDIFVEPVEHALFDKIAHVDMDVDYKSYMAQLEGLNSTVVKFFEDVLVMDKDENIKNNRLALLVQLRQKYDYIADFSKL
jgi:glycyl-tRNA synthetase beta chain